MLNFNKIAASMTLLALLSACGGDASSRAPTGPAARPELSVSSVTATATNPQTNQPQELTVADFNTANLTIE
ncbi:hypothetical protein [Zhongshania sp.]|uniref:hypothetical protein n=1 Tax=Zhongshania sp. TaxID=1971902 RepID=UPI0035672C1F